ncbi:MAG TPA: HD domain-containing protein [Acidimicrobiales bacterium]|nr:HD domain-containing protein [Acidimicrobiales bacterium]
MDTASELKEQRAAFRAMTEGTAEDWAIIGADYLHQVQTIVPRIVAHMRLLADGHGGFAVDRLEHSLQTATRAHRAGRGDEYVACALLHDIGDTLCPADHPSIAAAILGPYVGEDLTWMVAHHGVFQGYYYFHHLGMDRHARERYAGHAYYDLTAEFCAEFDQAAFDPSYRSLPLEEFVPLLEQVFAAPAASRLPAASAPNAT